MQCRIEQNQPKHMKFMICELSLQKAHSGVLPAAFLMNPSLKGDATA